MLQNAPMAIETVATLISWLAENMGTLIDFTKEAVRWFVSFKLAAAIAPIIMGVVSAVKIFVTAVKGGTLAIKALGLAMKANPMGLLITALTVVISLFIKAYTTSETFRDTVIKSFSVVKAAVLIAIETVKLAVLGLARIWLTQFQLMINIVANLIGEIPGIGDAVKRAASAINGLMDGIDNRISNSVSNIKKQMNQIKNFAKEADNLNMKVTKLNGSTGSAGDEEKAKMLRDPDIVGEEIAAKYRAMDEAAKQAGTGMDTGTFVAVPNEPTAAGNLPDSSSKSKTTDNRTVYEKKKDDIDDSYDPKEGLFESQVELAKVKEDKTAWKSALNTYIDSLKQKFMEYTGLEKFAKGSEKLLLEAERNKILIQIERLTQDIKGGIQKLTGEFNAPSEIAALTKYAYSTVTNSSVYSRYIAAPNVTMHITVNGDLTEAEGLKMQRQLDNLTNGLFSGNYKNDTVEKGLDDIRRGGYSY